MPRGAPDYSNVRADNPLHRLDDMAELAARLGSVVTFDRGGDVILLDTFANGMPQWAPATYGTGANVELTTERAASPPFAVKMTTGQDDAQAAVISLEIPYHHLCKMGLEYSITHHVNQINHLMHFYHRDGETRYLYRVLFDINNGKIYVTHSDGAYKKVAEGLNLKSDAFIFNQVKLVVDTENNQYVRLTFNDETWLLGDYAPLEAVESSVPYIEALIQVGGDAGSNRDIYVDNVIVTQNEP